MNYRCLRNLGIVNFIEPTHLHKDLQYNIFVLHMRFQMQSNVIHCMGGHFFPGPIAL